LSVLLTDTAGLRETSDAVEQEGQRRARAAAEAADVRLLLLDGSLEPGDADTEWVATEMKRAGTLLVLTKSDLGVHESARGLGFLAGRELLEISARTGTGLEALNAAIESELLPEAPDLCGPFTARQVQRVKDICAVCEGNVESILALEPLRKLIGTRPDPLELAVVFE
jgi:tRNA U34 5-carboxymethylaminomethyl modifying GTPase MnmE/TrmE